MPNTNIIKIFNDNQFPVNPPLPDDFSYTPNEDRPAWQKEVLLGHTFKSKNFFKLLNIKNSGLNPGPKEKDTMFDVSMVGHGIVLLVGVCLKPLRKPCCEVSPKWRQTK